MDPAAATDKQLAFRAELLQQYIARKAEKLSGPVNDAKRASAEIALALTLPEPSDRHDASNQIDSLKMDYLTVYAREHKDWAQPVMNKLGEAWLQQPLRSIETLKAVVL